MKRLLALVASTALAAGLMIGGAGTAQAAAKTYKYKGDTFTYASIKGGVEITKVSSKDGKITFPKVIGKKSVVSVQVRMTKSLSKVDFTKATQLKQLGLSAPYLGSTIDLAKNTKLVDLSLDSGSAKTTKVVLPKSKTLKSVELLSGKGAGSKAAYTTDLGRATGLKTVIFRYYDYDNGTSVKRAWSLTGLSKLKSLEGLAVDGPVKSVSLTKNTKLKYLTLRWNRLASLNLTKNTRLLEADLDMPLLTKLDVSKNSKLYYLGLASEKVSALNLTANTRLQYLALYGMPLTQLDLSRNTALLGLGLESLPKLTSLDLSKNIQLNGLWVIDVPLSSLDLSNNTQLDPYNPEYFEVDGSIPLIW